MGHEARTSPDAKDAHRMARLRRLVWSVMDQHPVEGRTKLFDAMRFIGPADRVVVVDLLAEYEHEHQ